MAGTRAPPGQRRTRLAGLPCAGATVGLSFALIDGDESEELLDELLTDDLTEVEAEDLIHDIEDEIIDDDLEALTALEDEFDKTHPEDQWAVIQMLRAGVRPSDVADSVYFGDPVLDYIFSARMYAAGRMSGFVDQIRLYPRVIRLRGDAHNELVRNTVFECGATVGPMTTACADSPLPVPEGEVLFATMQLAEPITALTDGSADQLVYAFVADTDGDPSNDWVANEPFDWDYFIGTDNWWELRTDATAGRAWVTRTDAATLSQVPTAARVAISGSAITFIIPADELGDDLAAISFRTSSFVHDGTFQPEVSGGDVIGANPTEPLLTIPAGTEVVETTLEDIIEGKPTG
ncbi:MAG: hypothetical protein P8J50_17080 [Acidimicrobiales bacterium]|nr:hypothetical protein [Acidimicrobiales bacterium]